MVKQLIHDDYTFHYSVPAIEAGKDVIGFYFDNMEFPQAIHLNSLYGKIIQDNIENPSMYTKESLQDWYTKHRSKIAEEGYSIKIQLIKQLMHPNISIFVGVSDSKIHRVMSMKEAKETIELWFGYQMERLL